MNKAIIGRKVGMTQVFTEDGTVIPVTVVQAGPCPVVQIKTQERDGYSALKLGYLETSEKNLNKPELGLFKKTKIAPQRYLREFRLKDLSGYEVGKSVTVEAFGAGEKVDVRGTSKGHGFSGVIKRWNHAKLKMSHGTGPTHRAVGAMSANSTPSRVFKRKKMPGQYGNETVTVQNLEIVKVDSARSALLIKGAIPGSKGSLVTVTDSVKA